MYNDGLEQPEIEARVRMSRSCVIKDLMILRAQGRIGVRNSGSQAAQIAVHAAARARAERIRAGDEKGLAILMAGRRFENVPFVERPFVFVDRPGLAMAGGTTASQCVEQGASGGWSWRFTSKTYAKAGAA